MVCLNVEVNMPFSYSGNNSNWFFVVGFKCEPPSYSEIKFVVLKNGEPAGIGEAEMTNNETFIKIPFKAYRGDNVSIGVMNMTDTKDIIITHKSITPL